MNPVPLFPERNSNVNPDTIHILREQFQDILQDKRFSLSIAHNLNKLKKSAYEELKDCGVDVKKTYDEMRNTFKEIEEAEVNLMESQGEYIIERDEEGPLPNIKKGEMPRIYTDIGQNLINKYSLIKWSDLLPHITERLLDARFDCDDFRIKAPCPETTEKFENKDPFPFTKTHLIKRINYPHFQYKKKSLLKKRRGMIGSVIPLNMQNKSDEEKLEISRRIDGRASKNFGPIVFKAEPKHITFYNYKKGGYYEKNLFIRNITTDLQSITRPSLAEGSIFTLEVLNQTSKIAPGMFCHLVIGFHAKTQTDALERLIILVQNAQNLYIDICSFRDGPFLKARVHKPGEPSDQIVTPPLLNKALNFTLDVGSTLMGYCAEILVTFESAGGTGKYFFISENDWEFSKLTDISEDNHLHLGDFHIYPAYFQLKPNETLDISIVFHPLDRHFHPEKVFLLCDNNTFVELDIIGDCLHFEHSFFEFQFHNQPPHMNENTILENTKYSIHLGAIYTCKKKAETFCIKNKSAISMRFCWKKKPTDLYDRKNILSMEEDWINIQPKCGVFLEEAIHEFEISATVKNPKTGIYSYNLCLYICDIPEMSIAEGPIYDFDEEYYTDSDADTPKLLSILVGDIEVQLRNIELAVFIAPERIILEKLYYQKAQNVDKIKIFNKGPEVALCKWEKPSFCSCKFETNCQECCIISIEPNYFEIQPDCFTECILSIKAWSYEDINETLVLNINNNMAERELPIFAEVQKPRLLVCERFIDLGPVTTLEKVSKIISIYNVEDDVVRWSLAEYMYDENLDRIVECAEHTNFNSGLLCHQGSLCNIKYTLDTTIERKWLSIIVFYSIENEHTSENTHCMILADIIKPKVTITDELLTPWVLEIKKNLNVGVPKSFQLYLHNDSRIDATYHWGEPYGDDVEKLNINFEYEKGKIYKLARKEVTVTLTALEEGHIENIYVPCEIFGIEIPAILQIICDVDGLQIIFSLPFEDRYINIEWPSKYEEIFDYYDEPQVAEEEIEKSVRTRLTKSWLRLSQEITKMFIDNFKTVDSKSVSIPTIASSKTEKMVCSYCEESIHMSIFETSEREMKETYDIFSRTSTKASVISKFESKGTIHENVVHILNIPLRQAVKKQIFIENITEIQSSFEVNVKNFEGKLLVPPKGVEKVLFDLEWRCRNEFAERMTELGAVVVPEPTNGHLPPKDSVCIEIWVYAETWGYYLEEIGLTVGDMPTFYFNLIFQVIGIPIEFPLIKNSDLIEPIVRFGEYSFRHPPATRFLKFCNKSTIPFSVVWHIFSNVDEAEMIPQPFTLICDVYDTQNGPENTETNCALRIMEFLGHESKSCPKQLFKIRPKSFYLEPNECKEIFISVHPSYYREKQEIDITAFLVGHIYIQEKNRYIPNCVIRPPDRKLMGTKAKILVSFTEKGKMSTPEDSL